MPGQPKRDNIRHDEAETKEKKIRGDSYSSSSSGLGFGLSWKNEGKPVGASNVCPLLTLNSDTLPGSVKVMTFDLDHTIIKTVIGRRYFGVDANDWEFWDESVPLKLRELHEDGYRILFFTNQAAIQQGKTNEGTFKTKLENVIKQLGIPVYVFASTGRNHFHKPCTTMWEFFENRCNRGIKVDKSLTYFVGDAAGRMDNWANGRSSDFSCSDRMFAANNGLKFATPEEYFLGEKQAPFQWGSFDAVSFLEEHDSNSMADSKAEDNSRYINKDQELVVFVGLPSSGKSTFYDRYFKPHGYVAVGMDASGTVETCIKAAKEVLKSSKKSVVADDDNPSVSVRAKLVQLAQAEGIPCRCVWMKTSEDLSRHLNLFRQSQTESEVDAIPDMKYNLFERHFSPPTTDEGFSQVILVEFKPQFDSEADKALFKKWMVIK